MSTFDLFQRATCLISEGDRKAAAADLRAAIAQIDTDGIDADVREDIARLLRVVERNT